MIKRTLATYLLTCVLVTPAMAQHGGTEAEQKACTPDVLRLCGDHVPDEDEIVVCLKKNAASLTPACRKVITSE